MAEYIERDAAYKFMFDIPNPNGPGEIEVVSVEDIESIPAADVVPVVRCEECVFHEIADYSDGYTKNVCRLFNRQIQNDDYCSYAWRRKVTENEHYQRGTTPAASEDLHREI